MEVQISPRIEANQANRARPQMKTQVQLMPTISQNFQKPNQTQKSQSKNLNQDKGRIQSQ